jgi:hypothetical protein
MIWGGGNPNTRHISDKQQPRTEDTPGSRSEHAFQKGLDNISQRKNWQHAKVMTALNTIDFLLRNQEEPLSHSDLLSFAQPRYQNSIWRNPETSTKSSRWSTFTKEHEEGRVMQKRPSKTLKVTSQPPSWQGQIRKAISERD